MTYAEYLQSMGASSEDIKVLDTSIGRKAFEAQEARIAAETARLAADAEARVLDYKTKADTWYNDVAQPNLTKAQSDATKANAEAARPRFLVARTQGEGRRKGAGGT